MKGWQAPLILTIGATAAMLLIGPQTVAYGAETAATTKTEANLRAEPNTTSTVLALLPADTAVEVTCWARGEATYGADEYGSMWLYTTRGGWVHSFLVTPVDVDRCGPGVVVDPPAGAYKDCDHAIAAGAAPVYRDEPGFGSHLDRDSDGIGCEWDD